MRTGSRFSSVRTRSTLLCATYSYSTTSLYKALTFIIAPLPNALFSHCGSDDFGADYEASGPVDLGRFITSVVVVTGFALPVVLAHAEVIKPAASLMSIVGGGYVPLVIPTTVTSLNLVQSLVYGTILAYSAAFRQTESDFD
jgi:hypothetical protein